MIEKDIKIFRGSGLNSDDDLDFIQGADARNRYCLGFINGNYDELIPRRVPKELALTLPATGVNTIIGNCIDKENNAVILFIHNTSDLHSIIRVYTNGTQQNISYSESFWNFQLTNPIYNPFIIGQGDNALLFFTDDYFNSFSDYNPPRLINISSFINGDYSVVDESCANLHKPAPNTAPLLTMTSDANILFNKLNGSLHQFAYRFKYDTKQRSTISPWSEVLFNYQDDFMDGVPIDGSVNNWVQVQLEVNWRNVTDVELFVRKADIGDGAPGYWYMVGSYPVEAELESVFIPYTGATTGVTMSDSEFSRLSDHVPFTAKAGEFIMGNRIALGNYNFGHDQVVPDIVLEQVEVANEDESYVVNDEINYELITNGNNANFDVKLAYWLENHVVVEIAASDGTNIISTETHTIKSDLSYHTGTGPDYYDNTSVLTDLVAIINTNSTINDITASVTTGGGTDDRLNLAVGGTVHSILVSVFVTNPIAKVTSMKELSKSFFAIQYMDDHGRESRASVSEGMDISITKGATANSNVVESRIGVKYTIKHLGPTWATKWRWLYGGSDISNWFYIPVTGSNSGNIAFADETSDVSLYGQYVKINLTQAVARIEDKHDFNPQTFTPAVGDFVRLIGTIDENETAVTTSSVSSVYIINKIDADYIYFYSSDFNTTTAVFLIEIFRRISVSNTDYLIYKEIGDVMDITDGYHETSVPTVWADEVTKVDQTSSVDGVGVINFGNSYQYPVYWFHAVMDTPAVAYPEMYPIISRGEFMSSYHNLPSSHYGQGRSNYVNKDEYNKNHNAIICGGTFNDTDLDYNELNKFTLGDPLSIGTEKYLNDKYGELYSLIEVGYTLYAFQKSKVTPIDLGRKTIEQDGETLTVSTGVVLGSDRPFVEDFGTIYPGSICKYGKRIWFYDPLNSATYQIAQDGINDISKIKMQKFFKTLSDTIASDFDGYNFLSFYDIIINAYVLVFIDNNNALNNWSLSYYPDINRWGCKENYKSNGGISLSGEVVLSFDENPYTHHKINEPYELGYTDVHFNKPPLEQKILKNISIDSISLYSMSADPSVWVDTDKLSHQDTGTYMYHGNTQQSLIPNGKFKKVNGKYTAAFLRNKLKRDLTDGGDSRLYNGEILAGRSATIRIVNTDSVNENKLRAVYWGFQKK
jgi:hypothetical protein